MPRPDRINPYREVESDPCGQSMNTSGLDGASVALASHAQAAAQFERLDKLDYALPRNK
jgi:hypothetical protein